MLNGFYASGAVASFRMQARLRALQETVKIDDWDRARSLLLETPWSIATMPELAVLAFSALRVGDALLRAGANGAAVRAYRMVLPRDRLIGAQRARLNEVRATFQARSGVLTEATRAIWTEYYRQLIGRIERQLKNLEGGEDYTPGYLLRFGQALLLAGRPREGWIIFEALAGNESIPSVVRREAHYRWILAAQSLDRWEDALKIARAFGRDHQGSPLLPDTLFLISLSYREKGDFTRAADVLGDLVAGYPEHAKLPRWIFTRGFCHVLGGGYPDARDDFQTYLDRWPTGDLTKNARLWHALSWFFDKSYASARMELLELAKGVRGHPLEPEVNYRLAATYYAMKEFDLALGGVDAFLTRFPGHAREPEAAVLRGDILMSQGELIGAAVAFANITPEAGRLFPYAVFQTGKIYRALEDYERMVTHFINYVERDDIPVRPRVSEALYWVGWAYQQDDRAAEALPVFMGALETYGNDPGAGELQLILQALGRLHGESKNAVAETTAGDGGFFSAGGFDFWLDSEREKAQRSGKLTYYSRLSVYLADSREKAGRNDEADTIVLEVIENAPIEHLDPVGLGRSGLLLAELQFSSAELYFTNLLERYPDVPQRAVAYYGLGLLNYRRSRFAVAETWLNRLRDETPMHPLAATGALLIGDVHLAQGSPGEAVEVFENLLRLKSARGRPHAEALRGLARAHQAQGNREQAIAFYQRIYTLYRAYRDLVAEAYLESARLFEQIGDRRAAFNSLNEMLAEPGLRGFDAYDRDVEDRKRLETVMTETVSKDAVDESEVRR